MRFEGLHVKILQSTIERLLYLLIFIMFIGIILVGLLAYQDAQLIKQNQKTNALAVKTYIACLLELKPTQTQVQVKSAEQACFDNAPQVK